MRSPRFPTRRLLIAVIALIAGWAGLTKVPLRQKTPARVEHRASTAEWQRLDGCRLAPNAANDGDSFHVVWRGQDYLFRLYFVDTPEAEGSLPERLAEQGAYFHMSAAEAQALGKRASAFTRSQLEGREFTIFTHWRDALGRSKQQRFYSLVRFDGRDLGETLVREGLARIYGTRVTLPDGRDSRTYLASLEALERTAKSQRRGGWGR